MTAHWRAPAEIGMLLTSTCWNRDIEIGRKSEKQYMQVFVDLTVCTCCYYKDLRFKERVVGLTVSVGISTWRENMLRKR